MKLTRNINWIVALAIAVMATGASASTVWNNSLADGDINNGANWSAGLPSDAAGRGVIVTSTPLTIDQVFANGGDDRSEFFISGSGGTTIAAGGDMTYLGDGLFGTTIASAGGATVVTHTGGTLTQDGGGAGLLVGHNAVGTYNISGGNLLVTGSAPTLTIDFDGTGAAAANGSSMTISGTGQVDVETGVGLVINSGGTLTVLDGGLLVWHDRLVSEAVFAGTVNAIIKQVGSDVHFVAIPTPAALPAGLALLGLAAARRRRR